MRSLFDRWKKKRGKCFFFNQLQCHNLATWRKTLRQSLCQLTALVHESAWRTSSMFTVSFWAFKIRVCLCIHLCASLEANHCISNVTKLCEWNWQARKRNWGRFVWGTCALLYSVKCMSWRKWLGSCQLPANAIVCITGRTCSDKQLIRHKTKSNYMGLS